MGLAFRAEVQGDVSAEKRLWPVGGIVVDERPATAHRVLHVRQRRRLAAVVVILAAYRKRDAVARRNDDARRPDLDVELDNLARNERLLLVVGVERTVRQRAPGIELPVRSAQPALADRRLGVERALEGDFLAIGIENAQHREDVDVRRRGGHEELQRRGPGDLHLALERRHREGHALARRRVGDEALVR